MMTIIRVTAILVAILSCADFALAQKPWTCPLPPGVVPWDSVDVHATPLPDAILPAYHPLLFEAGIGGTVTHAFVVDTAGVVEREHLCMEEKSGFDSLDALFFQDWRFTPGQRNGLPVRSQVRLTVIYSARDTLRGPIGVGRLGDTDSVLVRTPSNLELRITHRWMTYGLDPIDRLAPPLDSLLLRRLYATAFALPARRRLDGICAQDAGDRLTWWDTDVADFRPEKDESCEDPALNIGRVAPNLDDPRTGVYPGGLLRIIIGLRSLDTRHCRPNSLCGTGYAQQFDCEARQEGSDWRVACRGRERSWYH